MAVLAGATCVYASTAGGIVCTGLCAFTGGGTDVGGRIAACTGGAVLGVCLSSCITANSFSFTAAIAAVTLPTEV